MSNYSDIEWPSVESAYNDEYGQIDVEVHQAAGSLWHQAEAFALYAIHDTAAGLDLMLKAVAQVSKVKMEGRLILNLHAYLYQTYRRLVLARMEEGRRHQQESFEGWKEAVPRDRQMDICEAIERKILLRELIQRMDSDMRDIFKLRLLGYSFPEIARIEKEQKGRKVSAGYIRVNFHRELGKLTNQIKQEENRAGKRLGKGDS